MAGLGLDSYGSTLDKWQAVVNMVTNLQVSKKCEKLLE